MLKLYLYRACRSLKGQTEFKLTESDSRMYGYLVSTYESASLRRFCNGRVDNIRSAHAAAHAWAAAMCTAETPPLKEPDDGQKKVSFNLYGVRDSRTASRCFDNTEDKHEVSGKHY